MNLYSPYNDPYVDMLYQEYFNVFKALFWNTDEVGTAKRAFRALRQTSEQPPADYMHLLYSLFVQAGYNKDRVTDWNMFVHQLALGLLNEFLARQVMAKRPIPYNMTTLETYLTAQATVLTKLYYSRRLHKAGITPTTLDAVSCISQTNPFLAVSHFSHTCAMLHLQKGAARPL